MEYTFEIQVTNCAACVGSRQDLCANLFAGSG